MHGGAAPSAATGQDSERQEPGEGKYWRDGRWAAPLPVPESRPPTSASWLNLVERWFAELTQKKLRRGIHRSVRALERDIRAWRSDWNNQPRPFVWTKTADEILEKVAACCHRISDSGH
ncbi:hypothetical protein Sxan_23040 [Streptomyces xanthophaeus]|uniref:Transposase n=1 Tax=Streptomyces xanthophaeus TaxID=67385 RepID=A0A919GV53_9ACTN|nr:hypothetical protein Sxan_23040 [Streptomyces xanthophaeus]